MKKILIVHALNSKCRKSTVNHALAFAKYAYGYEIHYANALGFFPEYLKSIKFDLCIFTYEMIGLRSEVFWQFILDRIKARTMHIPRKILIPQDDYMFTGLIEKTIERLKIDTVYTSIEQDLDKIYRKFYKKINFQKVLTGYIDQKDLIESEKYILPWMERNNSVVSRISNISSDYGSLASRKTQISMQFKEILIKNGIGEDISDKPKDVLLGNEWLKFLGANKFTIGRKGGASIVDYDGQIAENLRRSRKRINSSKEQGRFIAISPRLLEAAMMKTCQILEEDDYLGILNPWQDYIPLKSDFSNIPEIISALKDETLCMNIASSCYMKVVESNKYDYSSFVKNILETENLFPHSNQKKIIVDHDYELGGFENNTHIKYIQIKNLIKNLYLKGKFKKFYNQIKSNYYDLNLFNIFLDSSNPEKNKKSILNWFHYFNSDGAFLESFIFDWNDLSIYDVH